MHKLVKLHSILENMRRVVVAFSGGLDSTFLLKTALDVLGRDNVLAVIGKSATYPQREYKSALQLCRRLHAEYLVINTKEGANKDFRRNPVNRCYYCKKELFGRMKKIAEKMQFNFVIDGFNHDDKKDLRYGAVAAAELGVRSPLAEAGIGKKDIRIFSKRLNLPTWDKPSFACLASRFPYKQHITKKKLKQVEKAEDILSNYGFRQVRVRMHNDIARIELAARDIRKLILNKNLRHEISQKVRRLGFSYITLDLDGYRTGSMNEVLRVK